MKKLSSGRVSLLVLTVAFAILAFFVGKTITSVSAHTDHDDGWGACVSNGPQCGTDNGTQSRVVTQDREYDLVCPDGYSPRPGHNDCQKQVTSYEYTDPVGICPENYHYQNNGNWNERCHRNNGVSHTFPEHVSPTGKECPSDYDQIGSADDMQCRKEVTTWDTKDKVKVYDDCPSGWTIASDSKKCQKTETQACHTGNIQNDACEVECPANASPNSDNVCVCNQGYHEVEGKGLVCEADPQESPVPEPSPTPGDVCWNLDGFQGNIPDGYHKDTPDGACNKFQFGGAPQGGNGGGSVLGASTVAGKGQVLGASTMAKTGGFEEILYQAIIGFGGTLTAFGLKNFKKASKKA